MSLSVVDVYRVVGNLTLEREYQRILQTQSFYDVTYKSTHSLDVYVTS
jgi:hypothetical protein